MESCIRIKRQGFTLAELIVTISILAAMLTFIMPNIANWYASTKLKGIIRTIVSDTRLVQQNSVTTQRNYLIRLNQAQNMYQLIEKNGGETVIKTVNLPAGITFFSIAFNPAVSDVEFNSAGVPNTSGTITLHDQKGNAKSLEISPSGFVKEQ